MVCESTKFVKYNAKTHKCIDGNILKSLIDSISKYYMSSGYITTKAYLNAQDISDGQIDIKIINGIVENIIDAKTQKHSWYIKTAFPYQIHNNLNLQL